MVRVAHLRASEEELDPALSRAAEAEFEDAVRKERHIVGDAAPRGIDVRDDIRGHAHRTQEMEEVEQLVPYVLQVGHRNEHIHRVDDDEIDLLALISSDEEVSQDAEPVPDLLGALMLDAEARDVDEEVLLGPETVMAHRPEDRFTALFDGHVNPAATRGPVLDQDVQRERRLHRAARAGDGNHTASRHPALQGRIEPADVRREAFVPGRRSCGLDGQRGHLLPQPSDFVPQLPQFGLEVLGRLRRLPGLRGPHPLHVHTVRHPIHACEPRALTFCWLVADGSIRLSEARGRSVLARDAENQRRDGGAELLNSIDPHRSRPRRPMAVKTKSERGPAGTLTVDDLTRAIKNSIDRTGMKEEEARAMAQHVLNFFGYSERIIDNVLEPEDRDAFYMLEDSGILTTEREETTLYDGREWRIHYWMFRKERIAELVEAQKAKEEAEKMGSVYDDVPEDFWASRKERPEAPK